MKKRIVVIINNANVSKYICNHLVGENHSHAHQMFTGAVVMVFGVSLTKLAYLTGSVAIHVSSDVVGYFIHAVGAIPFIKKLEIGG